MVLKATEELPHNVPVFVRGNPFFLAGERLGHDLHFVHMQEDSLSGCAAREVFVFAENAVLSVF